MDLQFYDNSTLSYHEKKSYKFRPDLSMYPEDAKVFVPNVPFMVSVCPAPGTSARRRRRDGQRRPAARLHSHTAPLSCTGRATRFA